MSGLLRMQRRRLGTPLLGTASALLGNEPEGMASDFTTEFGSVSVRDATTAANARMNVPANDWWTQSGTSPKLVRAIDGTYRWSAHNRCLQSQTLGTTWTQARVTVSANSIAAPDGSLTADTVIEDATGGASHKFEQLIALTAGLVYTWSGYFKAKERTWVALQLAHVSGAPIAYFNLATGVVGTVGSGLTAVIVDAGNGWYRCAITGLITTASAAAAFYLSTGDTVVIYNGDNASGLYGWGGQLNQGYVPTAYVPTTTAAVYTLAQDYDPTYGWGLLVEPAATNLALHCRDLSNAVWVKSNTTGARTATGIDGVANAASTLTATAGNGTILQSITSASANRITSAFVKRRTGTGVVEMTQDNGGTWTPVTVTSAWTRVNVPAATTTNPIVGFRIVTSGDEIDVDFVQQEANAAGVATSPIPTAAATVTRAADIVITLVTAFPYNAAAGTLLFKGRISAIGAANYALVALDDATSAEQVSLRVTTASQVNVRVVDGSVQQANTAVTAALPTVGVPFRAATAFAANDVVAAFNGALSAVDTVATLPTPTRISVVGTNDEVEVPTWVNEVVYLPRRVSGTELQIKTAA